MGHSVTVLLAMQPKDNIEKDIFHKTIDAYLQKYRIKVTILEPSSDVRPKEFCDFKLKSYSFHRWLTTQKFDIINTDDYHALGFYALMAKKCGVAHVESEFITQVHGPKDWLLRAQEEHLNTISEAELIDMERFVIQEADYTVAVSNYLADYLQKLGVVFDPSKLNVIRYPGHLSTLSKFDGCYERPKALAFFGRQEKRKGFILFLSALKTLSCRGQNFDVHILGKYSKIDGCHSLILTEEFLSGCGHNIYFHSNLDSVDAINLLKHNRCLAIIPSITDNLPNTVDECIFNQIPFITTSSGGQVELIKETFLNNHVCPPDSNELADKIERFILSDSIIPFAHPAKTASEVSQEWMSFINTISARKVQISKTKTESLNILTTVCIVHFNQPNLLLQTLDGLMKQTYKNFEIIIVDDGSSDKEALEILARIENIGMVGENNCRVLRQKNKYLGRARNFALENANGDFILFMDDDNYAKPKQILELVNAMNFSGADAVTLLSHFNPLPSIPDISRPWYVDNLPIGRAAISGRLANTFGDANAIFKTKSLRAVGGFFEDKGIPFEDWHCFSKLAANGGKILVLPIPLMFYRIRRGSMLRSTPVLKAVRNVISASYVNNMNCDPSWVQEYVYERAHSRFITEQSWLQNRNRWLGHPSECLIGNINELDDPNSTQALLKLKQYLAETRQRSGRSTICSISDNTQYDLPIEKPTVTNYIKNLNRRLQLLGSLKSKDRVSVFMNSEPNFSIELPALRIGETVFHLTESALLARDWKTVETRFDGLFLHPVEEHENIVAIPNSIPNKLKFISCDVKKLDERSAGARFKLGISFNGKLNHLECKDRGIEPGDTHYTPTIIIDNKYPSGTLVIDILALRPQFNNTFESATIFICAEKVRDSSYCHFLISSLDYYF